MNNHAEGDSGGVYLLTANITNSILANSAAAISPDLAGTAYAYGKSIITNQSAT